MLRTLTTVLFWFILTSPAFSQQPTIYPRVTGYFSLSNPIGSWTKNGFANNFSGVYVLSFPFGINIIKSDKFGVSFEIAPAIRTEKNISKVSNVLFHPGAMFRFKHGFTIIARVAFETSGRFGVTPVFNQVIKKGRNSSLFVSIPVPLRFGNALPTSVGTGLQLGVSF